MGTLSASVVRGIYAGAAGCYAGWIAPHARWECWTGRVERVPDRAAGPLSKTGRHSVCHRHERQVV